MKKESNKRKDSQDCFPIYIFATEWNTQFQKIQRCSKEKAWGRPLMGESWVTNICFAVQMYLIMRTTLCVKLTSISHLQSRPDNIQGALLIGQRPEPTRSGLQVHEPGQSSCHVELPQGIILFPVQYMHYFPNYLRLSHSSFSPPFREQRLVSTWSHLRQASSSPPSCPRSCPACTATSLTPTWASVRPWPASGTPWSPIRPW